MKYIPFLKLKPNEIKAFSSLSPDIRENIVPFFDLVIFDQDKFATIHHYIDNIKNTFCKCFLKTDLFFMDNYDHQSTAFVDYQCVLDAFSEYNIIPVVGLDRENSHIESVERFLEKKSKDRKFAIRFLLDDIQSFNIVREDILSNFGKLFSLTNEFFIILDARYLKQEHVSYVATRMAKFIIDFTNSYSCSNIIITSSSLSPTSSENISTNTSKDIPRVECLLWKKILYQCNDDNSRLVFGDYTVVSPEYADTDVGMGIIISVMTPRVYYTYKDNFSAIRGKAFSSYGYSQFFDIAKEIIKKAYFRGTTYSKGDAYIFLRGQDPLAPKTTSGNQGSWINATINSHITFMTNQF